eukprot:Skav218420  [mRNA]  locus=scaffold466:172545:174128:- [translate_table: standard]
MCACLPPRKDLEDFDSVDTAVSFRSFRSQQMDVQALVGTIQDGTFCTNNVFAKFDPMKPADCTLCGAPDTLQHRCTCCPRYAEVREQHHAVVDRWPTLPRHFTEHALVTKNPFMEQHWQSLMNMRDTKEAFTWKPTTEGNYDIFTDGSCRFPKCPVRRLASWSAVILDIPIVLASGLLPGLIQTVDLAELYAAHSALCWALQTGCTICIHSDSSYVVDGLTVLAKLRAVPAKWRHQQRWQELFQTITQLRDGQWSIHKVHSHNDEAAAESPLVEWWVRGNDMADTAATDAFQLADPTFWNNYEALCRHHATQSQLVIEQIQFLVAIAQFELTHRGPSQFDPEDMVLSSFQVVYEPCDYDFCLQLAPEDLDSLDVQLLNGFSAQFMKTLLQFLINLDFEAQSARYVTGLELLYAFVHFTGTSIPWPRLTSGSTTYVEPHLIHAGGLMRHTIASAMHVFKTAVQSATLAAGVQTVCLSTNRPDLHLFVPQWSLRIGWPDQVERVVGNLVRTAFHDRPHRRSCDLARPLL